mgnify:CR=1 FL=1
MNVLFEGYMNIVVFIKLNNIKNNWAYIGPYRTIVCSAPPHSFHKNVGARAETASPPKGGDGVVGDAKW